MHVDFATAPAHPDAENEDFVAATTDVAVLLDGAGSAGTESGCVHGVAWYARQMGTALLARASDACNVSLREVLRGAIYDVSRRHGDRCDLTHPGTPSATVLLARRRQATLDYLVLADSVLLIQHATGEVSAVSDDREATTGAQYRNRAIQDYITAMRAHRNRPNGFWVASVDPAAADQSFVAELPVSSVHALALLSDGASRIVDRFALADWPSAMHTLSEQGPTALIERTRAAEREDPFARRWPRSKIHDDATAAYITF